MVIKLNFINKSNDKNNSSIVIFQKPTNPDWNMETIAWKVIKNCGQGNNHPFEYDFNLQISAGDSYGNFTPKFNADPGDSLDMVRNDSGDVLQLNNGGSTTSTEIQVNNHLLVGSIDACCYRSDKLVAKKTNIVPGEEAIFEFNPIIYVGIISNVEEGTVINSAIVKEINTEFSLMGLKSADLIMTGGGSGNDSTPYIFTIDNKVM